MGVKLNKIDKHDSEIIRRVLKGDRNPESISQIERRLELQERFFGKTLKITEELYAEHKKERW